MKKITIALLALAVIFTTAAIVVHADNSSAAQKFYISSTISLQRFSDPYNSTVCYIVLDSRNTSDPISCVDNIK